MLSCGSCCTSCFSSGQKEGKGKPEHAGKRTDCCCCCLFIVALLGWIVVAITAYWEGNPEALIYGRDLNADLCGYDNSYDFKRYNAAGGQIGGKDLNDKHVVYYPDLVGDVANAVRGGKFNPFDPVRTIAYLTLSGVCMERCPIEGEWVCKYDEQDILTGDLGLTTYRAQGEKLDECEASSWTDSRCEELGQGCFKTPQNTTSSFYRCIPQYEVETETKEICENPGPETPLSECITKITTETVVTRKPAQSSYLLDKFNSAQAVYMRTWGDLKNASVPVFISGVLCAFIVAFALTFFLKYCAGVVVWSILVLIMTLSLTMSFAFYSKGGVITNDKIDSFAANVTVGNFTEIPEIPPYFSSVEDNSTFYIYCGHVSLVWNFLLLSLIIALKQRIAIAIEIIKEASSCLTRMPEIVLYPIFTTLVLFLVMLWFMFVSASLASTEGFTVSNIFNGSITDGVIASQEGNAIGNFTLYLSENDKNVFKHFTMYHIFMTLWMINFVQGIGQCAMAGAVVSWYWVHDKSTTPRFAVWKSFKRVILYNMGSVAMGSFFITVVQFIRFLVEVLDKQTKNLQENNKIIKCSIKVIRGCLWCIEKFVKFIGLNAYIMVAMKGEGFASSARGAFHLITRNFVRIGTMNIISEFVILLGKFFTTGFCTSILFFWLGYDPQFTVGGDKELSSQWMPLLVCTIIAFFVASGFFYVYDIIVDTIMLCFCYDCEEVTNGLHYFNTALGNLVNMHGGEEGAVKKGENVGEEMDVVSSADDEDEEEEVTGTGIVHIDSDEEPDFA